MSELYCSLPLEYGDHLGGFRDNLLYPVTYSVAKDGSILLPPVIAEQILVADDLLEILCFIEEDELLQSPYSIHCFHPDNTPLLRYLLTDKPDKRFLSTIDKTYRLHIPIDTLKRIGITKEVRFMTHNGFSWSIVCPKQEQLSFKAYSDALNAGTVSIPEAIPSYDTDR